MILCHAGATFLTSWGYKTTDPIDIRKLNSWAYAITSAFESVNGRKYTVQTAGHMYPAGEETFSSQGLFPFNLADQYRISSFIVWRAAAFDLFARKRWIGGIFITASLYKISFNFFRTCVTF